jgi:hypothetical protein
MMKLCPSWKVYQGWIGCDPFDSMAIPLCEVTVNNVYEMNLAMVVTDPIAAGLVDSLARPGGNITGFTDIAAVLSGKRL